MPRVVSSLSSLFSSHSNSFSGVCGGPGRDKASQRAQEERQEEIEKCILFRFFSPLSRSLGMIVLPLFTCMADLPGKRSDSCQGILGCH